MISAAAPFEPQELMTLLARLLLAPHTAQASLAAISREQFDALVALAGTNHVIVRGLRTFTAMAQNAGHPERASWAASALAAEQARIDRAVDRLSAICAAFADEGLDVTVIKSLDHWPDLGSDLDLCTNSPASAVCSLMMKRFGAQIAARSWGDRLACKWNFHLPGLPEPVEAHIGRLGQTGEQRLLASRLPSRACVAEFAGRSFRVPSAPDRIVISTLQRMYRHFYFRLCDIVDSATLIASGLLDCEELRRSARAAGVWEGVATYLVIVSDYVRQVRGAGLELPWFVRDSARFGGDLLCFSRGFLRVPLLPQSAGLYRTQLAGLLRRREIHSSARLGLLPWLATAAAVGQKITGSDKGIW
jgi:hypothetical protein